MRARVPLRLRHLALLAAGYALNEVLEVAGFELTDHLMRLLVGG